MENLEKYRCEVKNRGALNETARKLSNEFLKQEIDTEKLRVLPYIQYVVMNNHRIDYRKVNYNELKFLSELEGMKHLTLDEDSGYITITKEFWDFINEILFYTYVDVEVVVRKISEKGR